MLSMQSPLIERDAPLTDQGVITSESIFIQIGKRIAMVFPLLAMTFTTLSQIFMIAKNIAAQTSSEDYYNRDVVVISNGHSEDYTCDYGNANAVVVYCPYDTMDSFKVVLSLWIIYFVLFLFLRIYATFKYSTNDFRFYIATDQYNSHLINRIFVYIGLILTLISVAMSLYYMSPQTQWNQSLDTPNLLSVIVFFGINIISLSRFRKQFIVSNNQNIDMKDFPEVIPMYHGVKVWHSIEEVAKPLIIAYMKYLQSGREESLRSYGDVQLLKETMTRLFHLSQ